MTDQTNQDQGAPEGMGVMTNMDQMAFLVGDWFQSCHTELDHAYNVPEGTPLTVTFEKDGQPEEIVLSGDMLKGFKAGLIVAMATFERLPFTRAPEASNDTTPANDDSRQMAEQLSGHDGDDAASKD